MSKKLPTPNAPQRRSDGRWACAYRWTDAHGKRRCRTAYGTSRADAYKAASALQLQAVLNVQRGIEEAQARDVPTFAQLAERAEAELWPGKGAKHRKTQTQRINRWWLPVVGSTAVDRITTGDIVVVVNRARAAGRSVSTCNGILSAGGIVLQWAVDLKLITANPARQGKGLRQKQPRRRKTVLTAEQLRQLVDACEPKWRPLVGLMAYAGLRLGEAQALQGEDVDLDRGLLTVRRGGHSDTTKGRQARPVPIAPPLRTILEAARLRRGLRVSRLKDARAALSRAAERIGLEMHVHPHLLRHSFCTALADAGVGAAVVQRIMGHVDLSTTQIYMHPDPGVEHVDVFGA